VTIDYIRALAWPVVVLAILGYLVFRFRRGLPSGVTDWLRRLEEVGFGRAKARVRPPEQTLPDTEASVRAVAEETAAEAANDASDPAAAPSDDSAPPTAPVPASIVVPDASDHGATVEAEETLEQQLQAAQTEIGRLQVRETLAEGAFRVEAAYWRSFGSQIKALRTLVAAMPQGLPREQIEPYFIEAKNDPVKKYLHTDRTFEQWLQWLIGAELVYQDGDLYKARAFGRFF
jgi:hypothetical protein